MSSLLLDVNVLVAIAWPQHVHHRQARSWFVSWENLGWATSPMTESGFIRVSSNPRVVTEARTPAEAADLLRALRNAGSWEFWIDDVQMSASLEGVMGYRQVTDAHLLQLAQQRGGAVATFDAGLAALAATRGHTVELIPS